MHFLKLGALLCLLWFVLSGHTSALLLLLGLFSVVVVVWLVARMDRSDGAPATMLMGFGLVRYIGWLMIQVILSNIDVARRIWDPALPINPAWQRIKVRVRQPFARTLYANSITLTPGTVTTDVGEDYFVVHSLDQKDIDTLRKGEMENRILALEKAE